VMLHHGTAETTARVARAGDRFAQLRLSRPVVAARGDRVVLRAGTTVGSGSSSTRTRHATPTSPASRRSSAAGPSSMHPFAWTESGAGPRNGWTLSRAN